MTLKLHQRVTGTALLAALAAGTALAQGPFVEKRGIQEFTGQMIVRPFTATELEARGIAAPQARQRADAATLRINALTLDTHPEVNQFIVKVPAGSSENAFARDLMATGNYKYVEPNYRIYAARRPNDPQFARQWHHPIIRSEAGWAIHTGVGVIVGIVDTGVDIDHEDLRANMVPGYNSVQERRQVDGGNVDDDNGHGTHVAGCAANIGNNGRGVVGVGWGLRVQPIRVSEGNSIGAFRDDILEGIRWSADNGARIVNASWSGVDSDAVMETGDYVRSRGGLLFYSAGNDARNLSGFDHENVTVIGASDERDGRAVFSAYGRGVDFFAPGNNILASVVGGGYGPNSGTSMAAPVAAGLAALIRSLNPNLNARQIEDLMRRTCDRIGDPAVFGDGRINVARALEQARTTVLVETPINAADITPNFGTRIGGTTASITTIDRSFYSIRSARTQGIGELAGAVANFTIPNPAGVRTLAVAVHASSDVTQSTGGSIFLWNWTTGRFDLAQTNPVPFIGSQVTHNIDAAAFPRYIRQGQVRVMYRALANDTRNGRASSFVLGLDRLALLARREAAR